MIDNIKCTIITVSFNSAKTISRTIESVLSQTYDNIEYIIIDGKSTDNTVEIIKSYEDKFNGRMKWVSEKDDGIYYAMNKGISMASGDIIGLLNSDDTYENDAVEIMCKNMTKGAHQILYGMTRTFSGEKMKYVSLISHENLPGEMIYHTACFVTKNVYEDFGMFDTQYESVADFDFMVRMSKEPKVEFVPIYQIISNYWYGGFSSSDRAWIDLMKFKMNQGEITKLKYTMYRFRYKVFQFIKRFK